MDLAGHAEVLDAEERATMAEGGVSSPEFLRFMQVWPPMVCSIGAIIFSAATVT